jgi:hypothetical protein
MNSIKNEYSLIQNIPIKGKIFFSKVIFGANTAIHKNRNEISSLLFMFLLLFQLK